MCGVMGIGGELGQELIESLLHHLSHRGPDDEGRWSSPDLTLGHRRLSIIGLDEGGRQPMVSRSGRSIIVFNGEIYNYLELADELEAAGYPADRRYDTAVLLEALEAWGVSALGKLNGMFAFACYWPQKKRVLLARDRWGKKPLFWSSYPLPDGRRLVFSSELRTFSRLPGGPPEPDPLGVARYLVYDGMPGERTVYRGVFKVPAAGWLELDPEGTLKREGTYWSFAPEIQPRKPDEATVDALGLLSRSLELRLRSDVPVGLFLSGGLDSSLLAAVWRRLRPDQTIRTFTVGFEDSSYDERESARLMARAIDAEHHEVILTGRELDNGLDAVWHHLSEPFADPSIIPTALLCGFARQSVKVAIGGDGGDELQAGYDPFRAWRAARVMETILPRKLWHRSLRFCERMLPPNPSNMSLQFKIHHFAQGFLHPPEERIQGWMASFPLASALAVMKPDLAREVRPEEVLEPTRIAFTASRSLGDLHAQIHTWIATYLESSILTKIDRASMMHSLEVRAPLLDPFLAESLVRLPAGLIFRRGKGKVLLRRLGRELLPQELLAKKKKGLGVPQTVWLKTILRDRMEQALDRTRTDGWFEYDAVRLLWDAHLRGHYDFRKSLWAFLFSFPFQRIKP